MRHRIERNLSSGLTSWFFLARCIPLGCMDTNLPPLQLFTPVAGNRVSFVIPHLYTHLGFAMLRHARWVRSLTLIQRWNNRALICLLNIHINAVKYANVCAIFEVIAGSFIGPASHIYAHRKGPKKLIILRVPDIELFSVIPSVVICIHSFIPSPMAERYWRVQILLIQRTRTSFIVQTHR